MILELVRFIIHIAIDFYTVLILIYVLMSWIPNRRGWLATLEDVLDKICGPYLRLFQKIIPPIGGMVDISHIVAFFVLQWGVRLIVGLF